MHSEATASDVASAGAGEPAPKRASGDSPGRVDGPWIATYRLQLTPEFGFDALVERVEYLARLGVSHVYLSPCLEATPGSSHGYDVTDPTRAREDFGGEAGCAAAFAACARQGLGVLLDIVPNHMAASSDNPWWRDVLRWGPGSPYARYFDIDWARHDGRVLLPILGVSRALAVQRGTVRLAAGAEGVSLSVYDRSLPLAARSLPTVSSELGAGSSPLARDVARLAEACAAARSLRRVIERRERAVLRQLSAQPLRAELEQVLARLNADPARLEAVLEQQYYRLRFWRPGLDEINYRRFFDVSDLVALRAEDPEVFEACHVRIRAWVESGAVQGVRVDHPDGLADPEQYFERLRGLMKSGLIVAEKVLAAGERLPVAFAVDGTTGYDFLNAAGRLFVDASHEAELTELYCRLAQVPSYDYERALHAAKARALRELFGAEVASLTSRALVACKVERGRSFNPGEVQRALVALLTGLPVYRTYVRRGAPATDADRAHLGRALDYARREHRDIAELAERLVELMLGSEHTPRAHELVTAFQQLSGPAMAKGLEDTLCYDDARLLALNEVGGSPGIFGATVQEFHAFAGHLREHWPRTLLALSTHDTKRSADVRLRISLLSELPELWAARAEAWMQSLRALPGGAEVDPRTLYFLLQTLVGVWPISLERLQGYLLKAVREAKAWTSWLSPDQQREAALVRLLGALYDARELTEQLADFVRQYQPAVECHALALSLLHLTTPGIPDLYQGSELWDFSLADPDNRRRVDYALRERCLAQLQGEMDGARWLGAAHGEAKLWVITRALALRRSHRECFEGGYTPLGVEGAEAHRVVAFQRGERIVVVVPRLVAGLTAGWRDTRVALPEGRFCNVMTNQSVVDGRVATLLERFPVALLVRG